MRRNPRARAPRKAKRNPVATVSCTASPPKPACSTAKIPPPSPTSSIRIGEKYDPQDTEEDFLVERMAKARCRYNRIMPLEAAIFNIRLTVDQAPKEVVAALSQEGQRAWAYLRDANGGNALSKLSRYETALLREYDRSRQELEKLQKIRAAKELRREPDPPVTPTKSAQPATSTPPPSTPNPPPAASSSPEPDDELSIDDFQWIVDRH